MAGFIAKLQLGKQGLTPNFIDTLEIALKNHKQARISVLKSCTRDREKIIEIAESIVNSLKKKKKYRIIGFTIIIGR
jgi:RNA-binding protein YhbY